MCIKMEQKHIDGCERNSSIVQMYSIVSPEEDDEILL